jgi:hypothetical protein
MNAMNYKNPKTSAPATGSTYALLLPDEDTR